jgi:hypothetical protein
MPRTIHECEFCGVHTGTLESVMEHEQRCILNPVSRTCYTCMYATMTNRLIGFLCSSNLLKSGDLWKEDCEGHALAKQ